jgi:aminoglycoside phosphotransferase (APT) family kinase protein
MATSAVRDAAVLVAGLERWSGRSVAAFDRAAAGWSSETVVVTWDGGERVVLRLPPLVASYPDDVLRRQARVLPFLAAAGLPVPRVVAYEEDPAVLGAPFLVMEFASGRAPSDATGLDPWVVDAPAPVQRAMHERFADLLGALHRVDVDVERRDRRLDDAVRVGLNAELRYWCEYAEWSSDGDPPAVLSESLRWCCDTAPAATAPPSLLWGDARLGNVLFSDTDERAVVAALDWELASIGPAEMDVSWYLVLDALTAKVTGASVPGFLDRDAFVARHEAALGRTLHDLAWHDVFALARSICINDRQARIAAQSGADYPGVAGDGNPMLRVLARRIERFVP